MLFYYNNNNNANGTIIKYTVLYSYIMIIHIYTIGSIIIYNDTILYIILYNIVYYTIYII